MKKYLVVIPITLIISLFFVLGKKHIINSSPPDDELLFDKPQLNKKDKEVIISGGLELRSLAGEKLPLKSLMAGDPKIILRFSDKHCWSCVEEIIKYLLVYKKEQKLENKFIAMLAKYDQDRNFIVSMKALKLDIPNFNLKDFLPLESEKIGVPYFFVLDSSKVKMVHVPERGNKKETFAYLDLAKEYLLTK